MGRLNLVWVILIALSARFDFAQNDPTAAGKDSTATAVSSSNAGPATVPYTIGPSDTLLISVWKEPDLTATLPVRPDGMISVPLLDDVKAAGLTPMELAASLREKLKRYVADPRVTVVVTQMNSQRVYILG